MLILPIVNKNRILNVRVTLKDAEKIENRVNYMGTKESDIIINNNRLSESESTNRLNFIRFNSMNYPRNYLITTDRGKDSEFYDVYQVSPPPRKVNETLDNLYDKVLIDMLKEVPGTNKGKYLSFEKIGLGSDLTDDRIIRLQEILTNEKDTDKWNSLLKSEGLMELIDTVEFMKLFDCTVVSDTTISEDSLNNTLKAMEVIHTRDSKHLRNYYNMALTNRDIYARLSHINKILYNEPLNLIRSVKQKEKEEVSNV